MTLSIKQAILHVLDSQLDTPSLSDAPLEMTPDTAEFLTAHMERLLASDERQPGQFHDSSPFLTYPLHDLEQFVPTSQEIARRLFAFMRIYPDVPPADVLMIQAELEGQPHFLCLKLNYQESFAHLYVQEEDRGCASIRRQRQNLPSPKGKPGESFVLNLATGALQITEKAYAIDGKRGMYWSTYFLDGTTSLSDKQKFQQIKKAAETVAEQYVDDPHAETKVAAVLCSRMADAQPASVETVCAELCEELGPDNPTVKEEFSRLLRENHVDMADTVQVAPATVRRMEKQSLRTPDGVEIRIPVSLYEDGEAVEFIHNPDGSTSLLIKNVVW